jgi:GH35 family endo-1,4-beta-xylanase
MPHTPMPRGAPGSRDDRDPPLWAAAGIPVGAAVDPELIAGDERYARTLVREFNAITPENVMKWALIDRDYTPKPAYFGARDALRTRV